MRNMAIAFAVLSAFAVAFWIVAWMIDGEGWLRLAVGGVVLAMLAAAAVTMMESGEKK